MIAIITPDPDTPAETFVRQHIRLIHPNKTCVVYFDGNGESLVNIPSIKIKKKSNTFFEKFKRLRNLLFWGYSGVIDGKNYNLLKTFFERHRVQAVFAEFGPTGCAVIKICKELKLPLVVNFHGHDATVMAKRRLIQRAYRFLDRNAEAFVCGSQHFKKVLQSIGLSEKKIHVVPCGIETKSFDGSETDKDGNLILAVGRFVEKKAPHLTIRAFAKVLKSCPNARLEMIGYGRLLESCKELIETYKIEESVTIHGLKPHEFVKNRMKKASIFVQHSITASNGDTESQGVSLLEAMAAGMALVVTNHNGFKETVLDGETGFLVPEYGVEKMAEKMTLLLKDSSLRKKMGEKGKFRVHKAFEAKDKNHELYQILTKDKAYGK